MAPNKKTKKQSTKAKRKVKQTNYLKDEIIILVILAVCIFFMISHFGIGGYVGNAASKFLFGMFGFLAYIVPILLFVGVAFVLSNRSNTKAYIKAGIYTVLFLMLCTLFQLIANDNQIGAKIGEIYRDASMNKDGGGVIGGLLVNLLCPAIGIVGTYVAVIILSIICFVVITGKSFVGAVKKESEKVYQGAKEIAQEHREKREQEQKATKRMDKVVSGVSFNTTLEKQEETIKPKKPEKEEKPAGELFKKTPSEDIVINRQAEAETPEESKEDITIHKQRITKESLEKTAAETEKVEKEIKKIEEKPRKAYQFPPTHLLTKGRAGGGITDAHLKETARKLEQTLQNFHVNVTVTDVSCGPSVTRYELQPEQGVKVSKIVGLADDIKLNLAASDIRIEAPIPGKAAVGIEVPNKENTAVMLRDLIETNEFRYHSSKLAFATGRDIGGKVVISDIAKMPHVLIAGATGSGKSVCINTLIMSILYKAKPDEVKLIMIDPKVVELKVYNGIPHLLIPVVTDPKKAAGALNWAVAEMTRRYQIFAEYNVRDLKGYNEKVDSIKDIEDENKPQKMPQIVIIVDELADLMMVAPGEVEDAICRLAQLARACGIHLVLATQRPSVNVITGLIKANMPSRIAFAVSSGVDSRTIIDMNGAEKLLGKGDMLFYPAGYPKPVRVQGTFVSDREVQAVVDFLINNSNGDTYDDEITKHINTVQTGGGSGAIASGGDDERDVYFVEAGKFIIEKDKASIGMLQRVFKIGFNRAARIMDQLAEAGVVGEEEGTKPRKVLMSMEEFEQYIDECV